MKRKVSYDKLSTAADDDDSDDDDDDYGDGNRDGRVGTPLSPTKPLQGLSTQA